MLRRRFAWHRRSRIGLCAVDSNDMSGCSPRNIPFAFEAPDYSTHASVPRLCTRARTPHLALCEFARACLLESEKKILSAGVSFSSSAQFVPEPMLVKKRLPDSRQCGGLRKIRHPSPLLLSVNDRFAGARVAEIARRAARQILGQDQHARVQSAALLAGACGLSSRIDGAVVCWWSFKSVWPSFSCGHELPSAAGFGARMRDGRAAPQAVTRLLE
eukprot:525513-Pleurochrysis_carterae.AAC.1